MSAIVGVMTGGGPAFGGEATIATVAGVVACLPGRGYVSWLRALVWQAVLGTSRAFRGGSLSAVILNIVVGLMTSIISGAAVWAWGRARVTRRQRERARFFALSPGDTCRIVAPHAFGAPRTISKHDVFSIVELAKLMRDLRADLDVAGSGEGTYGVGDLTEFCVGGPTANVRMQSHLTRFLPGVSIRAAPPDSPDSGAIVTAGQEFLRERDSREYVLVARVRPPDGGQPLFLICGQTGITNRAAASYLRDRYRVISSAHGAGENWCIVLRVVSPSVYGHQMTELAADVSASAFSALTATGGPKQLNQK